MKITKLTVALAVSGFLALASLAHAVVAVSSDTYVFEANPDNPDFFNGSTVTIDWTGADGVASFSFVDTDPDVSGSPFTSGFYEPENYVTSYDTTGWSGDFQVFIGSYDFEATGNEIIETTLEVEPSAYGTWTLAPDASSTFPMLLGVMAALMGAHYCNRPRVLALARR